MPETITEGRNKEGMKTMTNNNNTTETLFGKALHSLLSTYVAGDLVKVTPELRHFVLVKYESTIDTMRSYPHLAHQYLEYLSIILNTEVLSKDFVNPYTLTSALEGWATHPNYSFHATGYKELLDSINEHLRLQLDECTWAQQL